MKKDEKPKSLLERINVSGAAAAELEVMLQRIGLQEKIVGSIIIGYDGRIIANALPGEIDAEAIGLWALGVYMNTEQVMKTMGQDHVLQIISRTGKGYLVIADFGAGILATISDGEDTEALIALMRKIAPQ
jgi:predicted regulator of Ras-like GTPase activity (Roadblock/LC7/MglB family)